MSIQVIAIDTQDFQSIITKAYTEGYLKAQREWMAEKTVQAAEPKFGEVIRGCKELLQYLIYKEYWHGSLSTLSKVAPQLVAEGDKQGHGLIFRRSCVDHDFANGFRFVLQPPKKNKI